MGMPLEVKELCKRYLKSIQSHPQHNLSPEDRVVLYKSFGESRIAKPGYKKIGQNYDINEAKQFYKDQLGNLTQADHILGWLVILTVKHVLPIWDERFEKQIQQQNYRNKNPIIPHQILEAAERVLRRTANLDEVFFDSNGDYHMGSHIKAAVTYDLASIYDAASSALSLVLYGGKSEHTDWFVDDEISDVYGDFASETVKAFSVIDTNRPGAWANESFWQSMEKLQTDENIDPEIKEAFGIPEIFEDDISTRVGSDTPEFVGWIAEEQAKRKTFKEIIFDPIKRLEFWEWWLTEAIPQAWEMAEQTYSAI